MKLFKNSAETLNWHMYFVNSAELTYVFCQFRRINYKLRRIDICIILLNYQYHKNTFANSAELSISQGKIGRNVFFATFMFDIMNSAEFIDRYFFQLNAHSAKLVLHI